MSSQPPYLKSAL